MRAATGRVNDGTWIGSGSYDGGRTRMTGHPGMIAVVQTASLDLGWHPHVRVLVTRGGWDRAGQWAQETQPFKNKAGQTAMDRGYGRITVQSGSGVFAFASVVDNLTNDRTTVTVQR